jgi:alpha-L-arabinofuranosidase
MYTSSNRHVRNKHYPWISIIAATLTGILFQSVFLHAQSLSPATVRVNADAVMGDISPYLTGVNTLMAHVTDDMRADGKLAGWLRDVRAGILRFPGGEVTDCYHWEQPGFPKSRDAWNPEHATDEDHPEYMDTDEYFTFCREIGAEPMLGINIESGVKLNRVQEGVEEAVRWVRYCKDKGYDVTWWFLGNESYHKPTYHQLTAEQYAELIVRFTKAIRSVDPDIKTIINWHGDIGNPTRWKEYETLFRIAGDYINVCDVHRYWSWGTANYEKWLGQSPIGRYNLSFTEETKLFHQRVKALGLDIKLAVLEWSRGPESQEPNAPRMSTFATGLIDAEMLGQFIEGGVYMATYWPLNWPGVTVNNRNRHFWMPGDDRPKPVYDFFKLYAPVLGQMVITAISSEPNVYTVAALGNDGETVTVYLINKSCEGENRPVTLQVEGVTPKQAAAVSLTATSLDADIALETRPDVQRSGDGHWNILLPPHSLTRVTWK